MASCLSVLRAGALETVVSAPHRAQYPMHLHVTAEFLLELNATRTAWIGDQPIALEPGDLVVFLPNEPHACGAGRSQVQFGLIEIMPEQLLARGLALPAALAADDPRRVWRGALAPAELAHLRALADGCSAAPALFLNGVLEDKLHRHPVFGVDGRGSPLAGLLPLLDGGRDLAEARRLSGLNETYFYAAFKRAFGVTPHQLALGRRLDRARARLLEKADPIAGIAADHGFSDQSHFSRLFKRSYACSPAAFQRRVSFSGR